MQAVRYTIQSHKHFLSHFFFLAHSQPHMGTHAHTRVPEYTYANTFIQIQTHTHTHLNTRKNRRKQVRERGRKSEKKEERKNENIMHVHSGMRASKECMACVHVCLDNR
mmetsp:Transcript_14879/g.23632  ORF Transcript_14879/g.23632 Transcript_14879/m.23632 type:complete len:109 (-) Transcript_14879:2494-2820(-)